MAIKYRYYDNNNHLVHIYFYNDKLRFYLAEPEKTKEINTSMFCYDKIPNRSEG